MFWPPYMYNEQKNLIINQLFYRFLEPVYMVVRFIIGHFVQTFENKIKELSQLLVVFL
jgi:hypothetical protein